MTDLEAVVSMAVFEAVNGYSKTTEACKCIEQYVEENYIDIEVDTMQNLNVRDMMAIARMMGVCFPANDGRIAVRRDVL